MYIKLIEIGCDSIPPFDFIIQINKDIKGNIQYDGTEEGNCIIVHYYVGDVH